MKPKILIPLVTALVIGIVGACIEVPGLALAQIQEDAEALKAIQAPTSDQEFPVPLRPLPQTITPCRACHEPKKTFRSISNVGKTF